MALVDDDDAADNAPNTDLLGDWLTLWHSELAAMSVDRELREWSDPARAAGMAAWATWSAAMAQAVGATAAPPTCDRGDTARADPAPRPAPAAAAPDAGGDEIGQLRRRVAELEQRLDRLERPRAKRKRG